MRWLDRWQFARVALLRHRFRSGMLMLVTLLGVAAVVVLTALGEGARRYVLNEFAFLGSDVLIVLPGRKETTGGLPPMTGAAARDLTLDDAFYLEQRLSSVRAVAPMVVGSALVSHQQFSREVMVFGTVAEFLDIQRVELALGQSLPTENWRLARPVAIIGEKIKAELLGPGNPVGRTLRIGDARYRVIGVLAGNSNFMGMNLNDSVIVPVASAQQLFNISGLFRLLVRLAPGVHPERATEGIRDFIRKRHHGEDDITVVSPDALLSVFNQVFVAMTLGVAAIAAISLLVAGVLVMNVTWINVSQRTSEIGLLKALGAPAATVKQLFLTEAVLLAVAGALAGAAAGLAIVALLRELYPTVPFAPPPWAIVSALVLAIACGIVFALVPVSRASGRAPIDALRNQQ